MQGPDLYTLDPATHRRERNAGELVPGQKAEHDIVKRIPVGSGGPGTDILGAIERIVLIYSLPLIF